MNEPHIVSFLIHIAGAAALLLWAVRLVRTGVERAFAMQLRSFLLRSGASRIKAAASGTCVAICLQSATAVAVLISNFANKGSVGAMTGLAILVGADIGSAIVSQLLLVRQSFLIPVLLLIGVTLFLRKNRSDARQFGRILIGIALIFISLDMISAATGPLINNAGTLAVMQYLGNDIVAAFLIGAAFAWLVHSSVAAVLLFVTLTAQGLLPIYGAAAMILGANLGGAIVAFVLTLTANVNARRMVIGNLILRGGGAAVFLFIIINNQYLLGYLGHTPAQQVINLHLVFNILVAVISLPFLDLITKVVKQFVPDPKSQNNNIMRTSALDPHAINQPHRAIICAQRETLQMGEHAETMLRVVIELFQKWDNKTAEQIKEKTNSVLKMHEDIKHFLAELNYTEISDDLKRQSEEISSIALNIETAANAIGYTLIHQAKRLDTSSISFSASGLSDIKDFHDQILCNSQLALKVFMTSSSEDALHLLRAKDNVRKIESQFQQRHLERLRSGSQESFETSRIHQETLRTLKNINAAFAAIGHPVAIKSGDLLTTRVSQRADSGPAK